MLIISSGAMLYNKPLIILSKLSWLWRWIDKEAVAQNHQDLLLLPELFAKSVVEHVHIGLASSVNYRLANDFLLTWELSSSYRGTANDE